jgi:hypothetical protein
MSKDDLGQEFLQHTLMEETADYLRRGRLHESLPLPELNELWVGAFRAWFEQRGQQEESQRLTVINDLSAELRLRGYDPPYDRVPEEASRMRAEVEQLGPDSASDSLRQKIREFITQKGKLKN